MGIFKRMKDGVSSKANAALDRAIDPEKELDMAILELEEGRKKAMQELVSYKATAKQMEQEIEKFKERAATFEKRAMTAVKSGDDELAKEALRERNRCQVEIVKITRDRDEAASYAIQLNKSRKEFEVKMQLLKMRKGTLATQIAAARSGGGLLGTDSALFDKFQQAEDRIEEESIAAEVNAALEGDELIASSFDAKLLAAGADPKGPGTDAALDDLKEKMAAQKQARLAAAKATQAKALPAGEPDKAEKDKK
jgi:phage shock protein A